MEGDQERQDLVADIEVSRGWEEKVVVVVDGGRRNVGLENMILRTIGRLVVVKPQLTLQT